MSSFIAQLPAGHMEDRTDETPARSVGSRRRGFPRPFHLFWMAGAVSSVGDGVASLGLALLAATMTRDPRLVAGIAAAKGVSWLVFGLPAGSLADRWDRRRVLAISELSRMAILLALGFLVATHRASILALYATAFAVGAFEALFVGAAFAALPALVLSGDLASANGRLGASETAGEFFAGPAVGGLLFGAAAALPFIVDGISFAASAALLLVAFPRRRMPQSATRRETSGSSILSDIRACLAYLVGQPVLRVLAVLIGAKAFCQGMWLSVLVLYALDVLKLSPGGYGLFLVVVAVGDISGSLIAAKICRRYSTGAVLQATGLIGAACYLIAGLTSSYTIAAIALIIEAIAVGVALVASLALRQTLIPAELLGRVGNSYRALGFALAPAGAVVGGAIAHAAGLQANFLVAAAAQLAVMVTVGPALIHRLRSLSQSHDRV